MRYVGRKLADLFEGMVQARHHVVERFDQPVQFVAGVAGGNLHIQIGVRDALRGVGHRINRLQRAARQEPSQDAAQHDDQRHPGEVVPGEISDHLIVVIERAADGQVILVAIVIHPQAGTDHVGKAAGVRYARGSPVCRIAGSRESRTGDRCRENRKFRSAAAGGLAYRPACRHAARGGQ